MRAGITTVMLPERNKKDYVDVAEQARNAVHFVWLSTVDDAIAAALEPAQATVAETFTASDDQRRAAAG